MDKFPKVHDFENGIIEDYRDNDQPSKYMFQVEHAFNNLPCGVTWSANDQTYFQNTHWAYDIGALEIGRSLAQYFKAVLVYSKFSRLYVDVNRVIQSVTLLRDHGDGRVIELNKNISQEEETKRIQFHSSYMQALRNAIKLCLPKRIYSIHSFSPIYEGSMRDVEIGILSSQEDSFSLSHVDPLRRLGYNCQLNQPWSGKNFVGALDCSRYHDEMNIKEGLLLEIRNDIPQDEQRLLKLNIDLRTIIQSLDQ